MKRFFWENHVFCIVVCLIIIAVMSTGCSASKAVTSVDDPDLRCEKISDSDRTEKNIWSYAYKNIPTVTHAEAISGDYNSSYVCIDCVVVNYYIELKVAFKENDGTYSAGAFLFDDTIGSGLFEDDKIGQGDAVKVCTFVDENGSLFYTPVAVKKIDTEFDIDIDAYIKEQNAKMEAEPEQSESATTASGSETTVGATETASTVEETTVTFEDRGPSSVEFGELLSANPNGGSDGNTLVLKVKIEPNLTNRMTITQNYQNVIKLVREKGCDQYDAIDYWAVADMTDGSESKVISFLVDKSCINGIVSGSIVTSDALEENLTDLWILPSLLE